MTRPRFLPRLIVLFIGSGCAALIYEIVWLQLLQLVWDRPPFPWRFCWVR